MLVFLGIKESSFLMLEGFLFSVSPEETFVGKVTDGADVFDSGHWISFAGFGFGRENTFVEMISTFVF